MTNYGDKEYWDRRYAEAEGEVFDWLEDFSSLREVMD